MAYGYLNVDTTPITSVLSIGRNTNQQTVSKPVVSTGSEEDNSKGSIGNWLSSPNGVIAGINGAANALNNTFTTMGAFNNAKYNYNMAVNNAQEIIDQTERQVKDIKKQWYLQDSANQVFMARSGLSAESFTDAQRDNLLETESTIVDMRAYARKQARTIIKEAKRAKRKAKQAQTGAMLGTLTGGVAGALIGGPVGAGIGAGLGSSLFSTGMQI